MLWPFRVTRAFSAEQLRLPALSFERIVVPDKGTEKLVCAWAMRRGRAFPTVTLLILVSPDIVAVVQPILSATEQSKPVKLLMQMQEQKPLMTTLVPPFWQVTCLWHCCSASAWVLTFCLRMTKNSMGIITAAAMRITTMMTMVMNPHNGSPQQRRPFFSRLESAFDDMSSGESRGVVLLLLLLLLRFRGGRGHDITESRMLCRMPP